MWNNNEIKRQFFPNIIAHAQRVIQIIRDTLGGEVATVSPNDTWGKEGFNQNVTCHFFVNILTKFYHNGL